MKHAAEEMLLHLLPTETLTRVETEQDGDMCISTLTERDGCLCAAARVTIGGETHTRSIPVLTEGLDELSRKRAVSTAVKTSIYDAVVPFLEEPPVWGSLTGVRPAKLARGLVERGKTRGEAAEILRSSFHVSPERTALTIRAAATAMELDKEIGPDDISLYVGIPFCPSRCYYCSFVSSTTAQSGALIEPYLETLCGEIRETAALVRQAGKRVQSIYIGGGTPTSLSAAQLEQLMSHIAKTFDLAKLDEYTVEAGRPDCTDAEKLRIIKKYGATRISINPQTFSDQVLQNIGRRHTAQDIIDCFAAARAAGHKNINMDLIAGLPGDTVEGFEASLRQAIALDPENITVHTLTLKRASNIVVEHRAADYADVAAMLGKCSLLADAGYRPYYMYRQKGTLQNLENIGWAKPGFECLYNIYIMEEVHTILSAGAGGSTKLVIPGQRRGKIERIFNFKYPTEYIDRFAELLDRKKAVEDFYARYTSQTLRQP